MEQSQRSRKEIGLDPENWENISFVAHKMVDNMITYLKEIRETKIWQPIPKTVKESLCQPLPQNESDLTKIYDEFLNNILPYNMGNVHPRFWGWVIGTGTITGALADFLSSIMNPNQGGGEHIANYVEVQVLDWCKQMLGYDQAASGILVSGGSMANLVGLTVARNTMFPDVQESGLYTLSNQYVIYGSSEMHSSIEKAVDLLGLGRTNLRKISVNSNYEIEIENLKIEIQKDKDHGRIPFCIVGNLGTVNTGATDDLNAIAKICVDENLWFHLDGAFGALSRISTVTSHLAKGLELADSIAFDLHKWMYMNYEIGVALVKDKAKHFQAFSLTPDYLARSTAGVHGGDIWFSDYGVQLSRGFRALKAWMSIKEYGMDKYAKMIEQNVNQAQFLAILISENKELELMAPHPMNIVCFRFIGKQNLSTDLNFLNEQILIQLHHRGIAVPSYTKLNGEYVIRVAITNHRSRLEDFEILVEKVIEIGKELSRQI